MGEIIASVEHFEREVNRQQLVDSKRDAILAQLDTGLSLNAQDSVDLPGASNAELKEILGRILTREKYHLGIQKQIVKYISKLD